MYNIEEIKNTIICGDCLEKLKDLEDNSVDSIVTDPPYELGFMGKSWDNTGIANNVEMWKECLRVLKPGGHLLAFSGTRTYHRMASAIEDAGFEVRDMIEWVYGSGFPKSLNIGKAVDKLQGNEREILDYATRPDGSKPRTNVTAQSAQFGNSDSNDQRPTKGTSEWEGWGTALKPAHEPICMARKPLAEKTVAENCLKYGTGGINIDGCRVEYTDGTTEEQIRRKYSGSNEGNGSVTNNFGVKDIKMTSESTLTGRFPANLIHDGSDEVVGLFPQTKGEIGRVGRKSGGNYSASSFKVGVVTETGIRDSGSASRFFYCAKASKSERNKGCEDLEEKNINERKEGGKSLVEVSGASAKNNHPTIKPIALMEYLIKMVTPKGGIVLDPFAGSGSTLIAAKQEGFNYIGIERESDYVKIAEARLKAVNNSLNI